MCIRDSFICSASFYIIHFAEFTVYAHKFCLFHNMRHSNTAIYLLKFYKFFYCQQIAQLREQWGGKVVPIQYPVSTGSSFNAVVDVLKMKMYRWILWLNLLTNVVFQRSVPEVFQEKEPVSKFETFTIRITEECAL